jgi:3',5'-cyclic AMP phosphodiesterase CpdA
VRIAIVTDSHLAPRADACERNWQAAAAAVRALAPDFTVHLGDVTLDGVRHREDLAHAAALLEAWPGVIEVLPGNHDMGDVSGERPLDHPAPSATCGCRLAASCSATRCKRPWAPSWSASAF